MQLCCVRYDPIVLRPFARSQDLMAFHHKHFNHIPVSIHVGCIIDGVVGHLDYSDSLIVCRIDEEVRFCLS